MKLYHISLLFLIICIPVFIILEFKIEELQETALERAELEEKLQHAVDNGIFSLTNNKEGLFGIDKDIAIEHFFLTLYASFGVLEDSKKQEMLQMYVPVIAVIVPEGFYFSICSFHKNQKQKEVVRIWSELYPYPIYKEQKQIEQFVTLLEKTVSEHNQIAKQLGFTYQFYLPQLDTSQWQRAITGPAILVLFQGYPLSCGEVYNRISISGAQLYHKKEFIVIQEGDRRTFHLSGCKKLKDNTGEEMQLQWMCYEIKECAELQAIACKKCLPEFVVPILEE